MDQNPREPRDLRSSILCTAPTRRSPCGASRDAADEGAAQRGTEIKVMAATDEIHLETHPEPIQPRSSDPDRRPIARWKWGWFFTIVIVAGLALFSWQRMRSATPSDSAQTKGNARDRGSGVVPVVAARARRASVDVVINGLGVVTPIYTVT